MKRKTLLLIISILCGVVFLSLQANAAVVVKDIEYLTGEDFVQLYFKIEQMIPIPDVFYPDKDDNTRIVMRMNGVSFESAKTLFTFDSSVIDFIKVIPNTIGADVDVEIQLKEQVNYRVFTNQKGLYIEFPAIKHISSSPNPNPPPTAAAVSLNQTTPPPAAGETGKNPDADTTPGTGQENNMDVTTGDEPGSDNEYSIQDILVSESKPDHITFRILMRKNHIPEFNVIPIPQDPARLAIDFKNTRCKQINKAVNLLNVRHLRGAYNTPSVYRVVFDLDYLKKYNVTPIMDGKGIMVEFFNDGNFVEPESRVLAQNNTSSPSSEVDSSPSAAPVSTAPIDIQVKGNELVLSNTTDNPDEINVEVKPVNTTDNGEESTPTPSSPDSAVKPGNGNTPEGNGTPSENGGGMPSPSPNGDFAQAALNSGAAPGNGNDGEITISQGETGPTISNVKKESADFFGDERYGSGQEEEGSGESEPATGHSKETTVPGTSASYTTFVSQTIDPGKKQYTGELITFNFHNADLRDVIRIIAKISGLNIVLDPGVSGRITSQLNQVPWDQAFELFLKINGLDSVKEGNIIRIGRVEELAAEAERRRALQAARQLEGELMIFTRTLSYAKSKDVIRIVRRQLSRRGTIIEDVRNNKLIISEVPGRVDIIDKLIDTLDTPSPQVSIEARIVEANAIFIQSVGIQWGYNFIADAAHGNQTTLKFPNSIGIRGDQFTSVASPLVGNLGGYAVNLPAAGATSGTVFSLGNIASTFRLDMALSAMESKGEGRIISAPKTTTQNNMKASLMQGKLIPVQILQNNTITVQWRPAALELKVTPQISADGTIICTLEIDNNEADFTNTVKDIPPINTQSIKTTVRVPDGGTIVIGGMYRIEKYKQDDGVPFFSKLPILGNLFKKGSKREEQRELMIFITPTIIK